MGSASLMSAPELEHRSCCSMTTWEMRGRRGSGDSTGFRMTPEAVDAFGASMLAFHPAGFRAMARASAEDLRSVPPYINVPTLLVFGDKDVRAPLAVAEELHAAISGSTLVVVPGVGHLCNLEAPEEFNTTVRTLLRGTQLIASARRCQRGTLSTSRRCGAVGVRAAMGVRLGHVVRPR
jgi:hypothetical protein